MTIRAKTHLAAAEYMRQIELGNWRTTIDPDDRRIVLYPEMIRSLRARAERLTLAADDLQRDFEIADLERGLRG